MSIIHGLKYYKRHLITHFICQVNYLLLLTKKKIVLSEDTEHCVLPSVGEKQYLNDKKTNKKSSPKQRHI